MSPVVLVARNWTRDDSPMWYDAAQPPHDCFASGFHSPLLTCTSTRARVPPVAATLAWTHHSLPRTPVKVASKTPGGGGGLEPVKATFQTTIGGQQKPVKSVP